MPVNVQCLSGEVSMVPESDLKEKSIGRLEGLAAKENGFALRNLENRLTHCTSNYEDRNFLVEPFNDDHHKVQGGSEDVEVNIVGCTNCGDVGPIVAGCDDATESMSSFGDTISGAENGSIFSDVEVESRLCIDDEAMHVFDGFGDVDRMRRKKLTDHWTRFIRPLAWPLKWLELRIKELQCQAQKYDRKFAEYENIKHFDNEAFLVEGIEAKTLPFSSWERRTKVVKRRKRTKTEETVDLDSYLSQHYLFSYYENKKSATDAVYVGEYGNPEKIRNDNDEFGFQDGWAALVSNGDDNIREIFLRKIDTLQLQVRKLKNRIDKVVNENSGKFSSLSRLSLPATFDALTGSELNPSSPLENGDSKPVKSLYTQQLSKGDVGDLLPESIVSAHEEANPISHIIENSILHEVGVSCETEEEEILIHNQAAKEEIQSLKDFGGQLTNNLQMSTDKTAVQASEANFLTESFMARVQFGGKTLPKSRTRTNVSTGKRKRGKRKSAGGRRRK